MTQTRRIALSPFHKPLPADGDHHKILFNLFQRHAVKWLEHVDELIIIDSGADLSEDDCTLFAQHNLMEKVRFIHRSWDSHWNNLNAAIQEIDGGLQEPYNLALLDSDLLIYDPKIVDESFRRLTTYDALGIFDSSGGVDLTQYPTMAENVYRGERRRLCPYFCFLRRDALRPGFDFTATSGGNNKDWFDSMGRITLHMLEDGKSLGELRDDRSSIYLEDDNTITSTQWLDEDRHLWSQTEHPNLGYYHIRNFSGGLQLVDSYYVEPELHQRLIKITPRREALRLLTWVHLADKHLDKDPHRIGPIIEAFCPIGLWWEYWTAFTHYYPWLESL